MQVTSSISVEDCLEDAVEMEDNEEIRKEDILKDDLSPMDIEENDQVEADDNSEVEREESLTMVVKTSYEAKLRELLRNICSMEAKIFSEASKEFVSLLRGGSGGEMLCQYVQASPFCSELMEAWKLRQGKPGMAYVLSVISVILDHPDGKYKSNDIARIGLSRRLDKVARLIIETKLEDVYTELNSKDAKRQNATLLLMAAVVRRGVGLSSEVAKSFDFKLTVFPKLAEYQQKKIGKKGKYFTRRSFIEFAISFLEIGNPRLLRWVLQQKDMYSNVLRGLGSDDTEAIVYVLSTLRDKVLTPESLVPPGLRSVLFGSVTLDQLVIISGNPLGGPAAEMAHEVLTMVCTDPCNGLMPDLGAHTNPLKGNPTRLLGVMKKLKATEIGYHRDLLLAIVNGRPLLGSAYMDEFPYILEPRALPIWFAAISLAADLVSSACTSLPFGSIAFQSHDPPSLDSLEVQCILKCIVPRAFSRMVINRGLLHSDVAVKHGSMRLLLEALKSLDRLLGAIDCDSYSSNPIMQKWVSLKQEIQDEARALLPDPQVLLKLLSSLSYSQFKSSDTSSKRARKSENLHYVYHKDGVKKLKSNLVDDDVDIFISGISTDPNTALPEEAGKVSGTFIAEDLDDEKDHVKVIARIWGLHECSVIGKELKDVEIYFHSKLLDVLSLYIRTMPITLEGSFDFFKLLPSNPLTLPMNLQQSLLSLLVEQLGWSIGRRVFVRTPELMYKHLQPFINLLIFSPVKGIKDQAYVLARAAMLSSGAFDTNKLEIDAWFQFLPGYSRENSSVKSQGVEVFQDLSAVVVSFFCDAVSTVGNNLYKHLDHLRCLISNLEGVEDVSPDFSPLIICILQKCLRLLDSDSRSFKLSEKSMISIYVCSTISFLLQTQVQEGLLSALVDLVLTERFEGHCLIDDNSGKFLCEWRPLKNLLLFTRSISCRQAWNSMCLVDQKTSAGGGSFAETLGEVKNIIKNDCGGGLVGVVTAFSSSIICTTPDDILGSFPLFITVSQHLLGAPLLLLSSIFFLERDLLASVAHLWPDIFFSGLEMVGAMIDIDCRKNDACLLNCDITNFSFSEELLCRMDFDSIESASVAFSFFLKQAPFYALFPAIVSIGNESLLDPTKKIDLFLSKLSEGSIDDSIASLRFVLFWIHQIQSSCRTERVHDLEQLLETCFIVIKHIWAQLLVLKTDTGSSTTTGVPVLAPYIPEIVETIFHHPAVITSLSCPMACSDEPASGSFEDSLEDFLSYSKQKIHSMDHHILNFLITVADYLFSLCNGQSYVTVVHDTVKKRLVKVFKALAQRLVSGFKDKFVLCVSNKNLMPLVPAFYIFHALSRFMSPFELLEVVQWIFCKFDWKDSTSWMSSKFSALSVGFYIADRAFEMLSSYLHQPNTKTVTSCLFWEVEGSFDVALLEKIYYKVVEFATCFELDCADLCLLKAVIAVYRQKYVQVQPQTAMLPLSMLMSRVIISSPIELLSHCICRTSTTKARLLFLLTEVSPLHMSLFGQIFSRILIKDLPVEGNLMEKNCNYALSDDEFMMLLPAALSYLNSNLIKFGKQYLKHFEIIPSSYSRIILAGFLNWKSYVSGHIFQEEYGELLPSSTEELLDLANGSLLGKAIHMLRYFFSFNKDSMRMKKRLKLFDSIHSHSGPHDELLDFDIFEINVCSLKQSLNFISRVVAKISFSRMLLFPKDNLIQSLPTEADGDPKEMPLETGLNREDIERLRFLNILVNAWHKIVKNVSLITENSKISKITNYSQLFRFLEAFILRSIVELSVAMQKSLIQLHSLPFLEQFTRSSFLYRFEDPTTLQMLRSVLTLLSGGKFSCGVVFELLLEHSQFVPTILWSGLSSDSSGPQAGTLFRPMSSILKSFVVPLKNVADGKNFVDVCAVYQRKLEVIKLLRVLYHLKAHHHSTDSGKDVGMNSRELLSLLLSCYGATLSEVDLEIYNLMHEIESTEGSECGSIAEMDYLWGSSALKIRREHTLEKIMSTNNIVDFETVEERRRRQFRENLPIDSKLCVTTVLHFPYDKIACSRPTSPKKFRQDNFMDMCEQTPSASIEKIQRYDPAFILHFSIHSLSMGYLEPMEFAALGLLAIAFVSISSPDEGMRKLGYEALGRFKNALENCRNRKDGLRLRLLLAYLQNGIEEPWQKIPSMIAIFAAEASFILLDPSHEHYPTISKLLMRSSRVNLKCIPLFHTFFGSSSVNFKTDRLWILRLSCAGLNLDDDAHIFIRQFILENLLSFYASSLSDYESKLLILQMVKKSVKLPTLARCLVERCGLISWLSSIISFSNERLLGAEKNLLTQLTMVLEIVSGALSFRNITEWLQKHALEQLSEFSSHLHRLLPAAVKLIKQNATLVNSVLQILVSTLRISQKRKIYQPHFTLSVEGLFQLYQAINDEFSNMESGLRAELGLKAILMSTPPTVLYHMNGEKLSKFVLWAISTALWSYSTREFQLKESDHHSSIFLEEEQSEDSLLSKLLRWVAASVILGRISGKSCNLNTFSSPELLNIETLQSLLEHIKKGHGECRESNFGNDEVLAAMILYLQQCLGLNCRVLPSVISALCILLLSDAPSSTGTDLLPGNYDSVVTALCSKIRCPAEANPAWRWSFYQPWKDLSLELTGLQKMDEHHACQTLLVIFSNALGKKALDFPMLSSEDVENSGVFMWERSILEAE